MTNPRKMVADRAGRSRPGPAIPAEPAGSDYADDLDRYLDRLLDEALEETFPASDTPAVPRRRDIEKR